MAATMEKPRKKAKAQPSELAKLPTAVVEKGRLVSSLTGRTMLDIFGEILLPELEKMERELVREKAQQLGYEVHDQAKGRKGGA